MSNQKVFLVMWWSRLTSAISQEESKVFGVWNRKNSDRRMQEEELKM
jgi:hypothetical protein